MARLDPITADDDWFTGEDKVLPWTIYTDDTGSTPQNITSYTFQWELRKFRDSPLAVLTKTSVSGIAIISGSGGTLTVTIAAADTDLFEPGTYYHELFRTNAGARTIESYGTAVLQRGVRL